MKKFYIIPIFIPHRGCPHDCIFCNQKRIAGVGTETTGVEVKERVTDYLKTFPKGEYPREIAFYGGSFTGLPLDKQGELLAPAAQFLESGEIHGIRLSTRPDYITEEILKYLKGYGVTTIELGVQSTNNEVLNLSKRGHTKEDVVRAVELIKSHHFTLGLQMMIGLPGDHKGRIHETVQDFIRFKPDFVRIYPTLVIKDTRLEELFKSGKYKPFTLEECIHHCKEALIFFQGSKIPVIRLGLQSTEEITYGKGIVAGPYHPAFREMVESEIFRGLIEEQLLKLYTSEIKNVTVYCHGNEPSKVAGFQQSNKNYFIDKYSLKHLNIRVSAEIMGGEIRLQVDE